MLHATEWRVQQQPGNTPSNLLVPMFYVPKHCVIGWYTFQTAHIILTSSKILVSHEVLIVFVKTVHVCIGVVFPKDACNGTYVHIETLLFSSGF